MLTLVPVFVKTAMRWVREHHSHLPKVRGGAFAVGVAENERLVCVALAGRPPRMLQRVPTVLEVTRVASDGTAPHAASKALGAIVRAALALGYRRLVSYTLLGEAGTSYRAAGWWPVALSHGGEWDRPSRPRKPSVAPGEKVRWEAGPDREPFSAEVDEVLRAHVGLVAFRPRCEDEAGPLFAGSSP